MTPAPYIPSGEKHLGLWLSASFTDPIFVYVIQGDPDTPIKVGVARDVDARMRSLQTGYPYRLRLLYVLPGDHRLEWYLHQRLKGARLQGEWFKPGPIVDEFLEYVHGLAQQLADAYDGGYEPPDFEDFDGIREALPASKRRQPIEVRYVEPDPALGPDEAKALKRLIIRHGQYEGRRRFDSGWRA